jgi:hypothetical protein
LSRKIQEILNNLKLIQETYPEDANIFLMDTEKVLACLPGQKIKINLNVGESIDIMKGTVAYEALQLKRKLREERGPERYGIAYISTAVPIWEDNKVVGVLASAVSAEKFYTLRQSTAELSTVVQELSKTSEDMAKATDFTAQRIFDLTEESERIKSNIKDIKNIINFIKDISNQSHILGLNAAIESARAGEHGRGFSVVSKEIQNMAASIKKFSEQIQIKLENTQNEILFMNSHIQEIAAYTQEHSANVEQFHSAFHQISITASNLKERSLV